MQNVSYTTFNPLIWLTIYFHFKMFKLIDNKNNFLLGKRSLFKKIQT